LKDGGHPTDIKHIGKGHNILMKPERMATKYRGIRTNHREI